MTLKSENLWAEVNSAMFT